MNYETQTIEMLINLGFTEAPSNNKQWRILFKAEDPDARWFVHTSGKVRRGKSVHSSEAITEEARTMLSDWLTKERVDETQSKIISEQKGKPKNGPSKRVNKTLQVMAALGRDEGVTIDELTAMTGWQPHSVRGFLSNTRKKLKEKADDKQIVKCARDGQTMYKLEKIEVADE